MAHSIPNAMHVFLSKLTQGQFNALIKDANQGYAVELDFTSVGWATDNGKVASVYKYRADMGDVLLDVYFKVNHNDIITVDFELAIDN